MRAQAARVRVLLREPVAQLAQARGGLRVGNCPLGGELGVLRAGSAAVRSGMDGTHLAVEVEDAPAVVDGDGGGAVEPRAETAYPRVEPEQVAAEEEEELHKMVADERVPEEARLALDGLRRGQRPRTRQ